jgi:hypothetical protein
MSTEARITPYDGGGNRDQGSGLAGDIAIGAIGLAAGVAIASVALIAKSIILDEKQKEVVARRKEKERKERARLIKPEKPELIAVPLKLTTSDTVVQSAINLGFKPFEMPNTPIQSKPSITLTKPSGETLTLMKAETGRLSIVTHGNSLSTICEVMQRHTIDQAINHLKKQCRSVEVKKGAGGDYVIVAQEGNRGQKGGPARITAHISKDGIATVDVSNIKGPRCEEIINGIARAIGGECVKSRKKSEYFQMPVEEKENIRV